MEATIDARSIGDALLSEYTTVEEDYANGRVRFITLLPTDTTKRISPWFIASEKRRATISWFERVRQELVQEAQARAGAARKEAMLLRKDKLPELKIVVAEKTDRATPPAELPVPPKATVPNMTPLEFAKSQYCALTESAKKLLATAADLTAKAKAAQDAACGWGTIIRTMEKMQEPEQKVAA